MKKMRDQNAKFSALLDRGWKPTSVSGRRAIHQLPIERKFESRTQFFFFLEEMWKVIRVENKNAH